MATLEKREAVAGWTPGPLKVVLDGTMTGVWAEIRQECIDPGDGEEWERGLGRSNTAYIRRADAYPKTEGADFRPFGEAPEQFELTEDGKEAIANAYLWAAAGDLYKALSGLMEKERRLYGKGKTDQMFFENEYAESLAALSRARLPE